MVNYLRIPIHEKNAKMGGKKPLWLILPLLMWQRILSTPMQGSDTTTSQVRSLCLQAHSKPEHTVGMCSSWHEQHRNVLEASLLPRSGNHASNNTKHTPRLQSSTRHMAQGAKYAQERRTELFARSFTPQTYKLLSQILMGTRRKWFLATNLFNTLHSPIRKAIQILSSYQLKNYIQKVFWITWDVSITKSETSGFAEMKSVDT